MASEQRTVSRQVPSPRAIALLTILTSASIGLVGACSPGDADTGATNNGTDASQPSATAPQWHDARELLERMAAAYRAAESYADNGQGRLRLQRDGELINETFPFAVVFERPNRLRVQCYNGVYLCDGERVRASVSQLPGQVLDTPAPDVVAIDSVFHDETLAVALGGGGAGIAGIAPQLSLLLTEDFVGTVTQTGEEPRLLTPEKIGSTVCERVRISRPDGALVLWIDRQTLVLRRIEYPTIELTEQMQLEGPVDGVWLTADFSGAQIDIPLDDVAFSFEVPPDAQLVEVFDRRPLIPRPVPPSELVGNKIDRFQFVGLDGTTLNPATLDGKVVVLEFWSTSCIPCVESLPRLERIYQQYRDNEEIVFYAVTTDPSDVDDERLRQRFRELNVTIPIARDPQLAARDVFGIEGIPNLFLLGPSGTVEHNEIGASPTLEQALPAYIEQLLAGESVAEHSLAQYEQELRDYERLMSEPPDGGQAATTQQPQAVAIAPRTEPGRLQFDQLWTTDTLTRPGNALSVTADERQLFVLEADTVVVEFDDAGEIVARHELDLPEGAAITYLRAEVDGDGARWFAGSAPAQPQVHVFDDQWQLQLSYPRDPSETGVADVQLADLDGDGSLELLVSYWGATGVEAVGIDGSLKWAYRDLEDVFSLAVTDPDASRQRVVLCSNRRGTLVPVDAVGNAGNHITLEGRFPVLLRSSSINGRSESAFAAISPKPTGGDVVIGLSPTEELWAYDLPPGVHQRPIEMLAATTAWREHPHLWIVATADGTLHLLDRAGALVDRFQYGAELTGCAATRIDDEPALLVTCNDESGPRVDAWRVVLPAELAVDASAVDAAESTAAAAGPTARQ
mgnify:CR=1 FL=1